MFTKKDVIKWILDKQALNHRAIYFEIEIREWLEERKDRSLSRISSYFMSEDERVFDRHFKDVIYTEYQNLPDTSYSIDEILAKI